MQIMVRVKRLLYPEYHVLRGNVRIRVLHVVLGESNTVHQRLLEVTGFTLFTRHYGANQLQSMLEECGSCSGAGMSSRWARDCPIRSYLLTVVCEGHASSWDRQHFELDLVDVEDIAQGGLMVFVDI